MSVGSKAAQSGAWSGSRSGLFSVSPRFSIFMDRIPRHSQELEAFRFGSLWISSLLFADDVASLVPSGRDLRDVPGVVCHRACLRKKGVFLPPGQLLHIKRSQLRCLDASVRTVPTRIQQCPLGLLPLVWWLSEGPWQ